MKEKIKAFFDNADEVVKRSKKLIISIVAGVGAIVGAVFFTLDSIAPDDEADEVEMYDDSLMVDSMAVDSFAVDSIDE